MDTIGLNILGFKGKPTNKRQKSLDLVKFSNIFLFSSISFGEQYLQYSTEGAWLLRKSIKFTWNKAKIEDDEMDCNIFDVKGQSITISNVSRVAASRGH